MTEDFSYVSKTSRINEIYRDGFTSSSSSSSTPSSPRLLFTFPSQLNLTFLSSSFVHHSTETAINHFQLDFNFNHSSQFFQSTITTSSVDGGFEDKPPPKSTVAAVLICILCSIVIVGTLFGNILVCLAVAITRKLRTPSNSLIVSLAFSDLLIAITVMPFAVVLEVTGNWIFGQVACDIWTSLDVLLCTSSILNLCVISIDRYLVITRPFTYALKRTPLRMAIMVAFVWLASAVISIPPQFGWRKPVKEGQCVISEEIGYQLFATVGAFYLPLLVMIIIYTRIYLVSSRLSKTVSCNRQPSLASVGGSGSPSDQLTSFQAAAASDSSKRRRQSSPCFDRHCYDPEALVGPDKRRKSSSVLVFDKINNKRNHHHRYRISKSSNSCSAVSQPTLATNSAFASSAGSLSSSVKKYRSRSVSQMWGKINNKLKLSSIKPPRTNSERKATRTLGVIMGSFIACWLPFFILALVKPFLGEFSNKIPGWLDTVFLWLGYANSFFNPIIYARFNRDFRVPFRYILQCRCRSINSHMRVTEFAEQFGRSDSGLNQNTTTRGREHSSLTFNPQTYSNQRHKHLKIRHNQTNRTSINKQFGVADEHQLFLHNAKTSNGCDARTRDNKVPRSLAERLTVAVTPSKTYKKENFKRTPTPPNLVFKRYDPQSKRNNVADSYMTSMDDVDGDNGKYLKTYSSLNDSPDNCYHAFKHDEATPVVQSNRHGRLLHIPSRPEDLHDLQHSPQQIQHTFNSKTSTPTTSSKSRTNHKEYRRPNAENQYKLYAPKICHAPVVNMSMVVDEDDEQEDTDDEKNALKVADDEDGDDQRTSARGGKPSEKSILETTFQLRSLDDSSADVGSSSSRDYLTVKVLAPDDLPNCGQNGHNGALKVFNASFNEINREHSFVF